MVQSFALRGEVAPGDAGSKEGLDMSGTKKQMVINYVPGEECRVAMVQDKRLEEFHAERMDGPRTTWGTSTWAKW